MVVKTFAWIGTGSSMGLLFLNYFIHILQFKQSSYNQHSYFYVQIENLRTFSEDFTDSGCHEDK